MASSKMHLGSTFDPVKYEQLQEEAERDDDAKTKLERMEEGPPPRTRRRFNTSLLAKMKRLATKTMSFVSRIGSRKRHSANHSTNEQDLKKEVRDPTKEAFIIVTASEPSHREDTATIAPVDVDTPRRYKHQLPHEEPKPLIAKGLVIQLAQRLEPHFSGIMPSQSSTVISVNGGEPEEPQEHVGTKDKLASAAICPSRDGPKLHIKSSGLTESSDEEQGEEEDPSQLGMRSTADGNPAEAFMSHTQEDTSPLEVLQEALHEGGEEGEEQLLEDCKCVDGPSQPETSPPKIKKRVRFADFDKPSVPENASSDGAVSAEEETSRNANASSSPDRGVGDEEKSLRIRQRKERIQRMRKDRMERRQRLSQSRTSTISIVTMQDEPSATESAGGALQWARERAAAAADAKIFRREERLLRLLKQAFEED